MNIKVKRKCYCVVSGCKSAKTVELENLSFHKSPLDKAVYNKWCIALKVKKLCINSVVCSKHFLPEDYYPAREGTRKVLKKSAIPSLNLPVSLITTLTKDKDLPKERKSRLDARNLKKFKRLAEQTQQNVESNESNHMDSINAQDSLKANVENNRDLTEEEDYSGSITDNQIDDSDAHLHTQSEYESTKKDKSVQVDINTSCDKQVDSNKSSDQETKSTPSILDFLHTDAQLYTYTGIKSFEILDALVQCIEELRKVRKKKTSKLSARNSVLLTFIKLKQNQSYCALGVLFQLSNKVTKKCFINTLKELAQVLSVLIRWPSKEEILNNMPKCFSNYKSTRIVLDCLEIAIRQSKCLKCRIPTYSNYKSCHTVKFMLGVTPSGMVSYVSKAYGGRVSDKLIFTRSKILDRMIRCVDHVMVDRGFLIDKECADYGIKLIRPPFLRKKKQLSHKEATMNADIAAARVHVERRIQRLRVFKILQGPLDTEIVPYINLIMKVICGLTNLDSPILAEDKFISNNLIIK